MSLENIKKKILSDAEARKDEILQNAKDEEEKIKNSFQKECDEYKKDVLAKAKDEGESVKRGIIIDARQTLNNSLLEAKRENLDLIFEEAEKEFITSSDYKDLMTKSLSDIKLSGKTKVIFSKNEKTLDEKWLKSIHSDFEVSNEKGDFKGGVVVKEDTISFNITIEALFEELRSDIESDIAKKLF